MPKLEQRHKPRTGRKKQNIIYIATLKALAKFSEEIVSIEV